MDFISNVLPSYFTGLLLGGGVCIISLFLDTTFCRSTFLELINNDSKKYIDGIKANFINMICIGPATYSIISYAFTDNSTTYIQLGNLTCLLITHNGLYYIFHYLMHKPILYSIHKFHHQYDNILLPSLGNAVSKEEFLLAYMSPFIIGAKLFNPNETTFIAAISIIASLNMAIHTKELENVQWIKYLVSPNQHLEHHRIKDKHYAAPLLNIDFILKEIYEQ